VPAVAPAPIPAPPLVVPSVIDSALKSLVDSKQIVGVSALIYERGQEAYFGAFGLADRENNKPFARDTVEQIFSKTNDLFRLHDATKNARPWWSGAAVGLALQSVWRGWG
jgi:hypothetical protein